MPVMLLVAWLRMPRWFLVCLAVSLLSDAVDGWAARRLRQESAVGARLDSVADLASFAALPLCLWWLWPSVMRREAVWVVTIVASYWSPLAIGFLKFRQQTSYHTWGAKSAAVACGVGTILLFADVTPWLFRVGTVAFALEAAEEIAITLTLKRLRANVPTLWHARYQSAHRATGRAG